MERTYPSYYHTFSCIASACPDSCCHEWEVQVDEATAACYRAMEGELGADLRKDLYEEDGRTYLHFPAGLITSGVYLHKFPGLPKSVRLMNTGEALPFEFNCPPGEGNGEGKASGPFVRIHGIPSDREPLLTEPAVMEIEW